MNFASIKQAVANFFAVLCVCDHEKSTHATDGTCSQCACQKYAARGQTNDTMTWG